MARASIQLESFDFEKLSHHQFNILIEQNNTSPLPTMIFEKMMKKYQHTYFVGQKSSISEKIPSSNHFDIQHFQFQLSSFYEQMRSTNVTATHSLLVIQPTPALLQRLLNFPCFYDIIQNRKKYNMGILIIMSSFPKKFDILRKQIDYCLFGSIIQEQELLSFVGPLFDPPYLYLQVHKTVYNENNYIAIVWNSTSSNLQDRIFWYDVSGEGEDITSGNPAEAPGLEGVGAGAPPLRELNQMETNSPSLQQQHQHHQQVPTNVNTMMSSVVNTTPGNMGIPSRNTANGLTPLEKQRIWKKIGLIKDLLADIEDCLR